MNFLIAKQGDGFRVWFTVSSSAGTLRTGLVAGNFTVTVVDPDDSASATYVVSQSTQKPGLYYFDTPAAFLIANGVGDYVAVVEVSATAPTLRAVASTMISVSLVDIDDLASAVTPTAIADGVWDALTADHTVADSFGVLLGVSVYTAKVMLIDDDTLSTDRYVVRWFKNGVPLSSGVTTPLLQVVKASDGTDLFAATAMTAFGVDGRFRYDATGTERTESGLAYLAIATATIDGQTREWDQPVGRDAF